MIASQCISVTDLRLKTKESLSSLREHEKIVFVNNKPIAALISIEEYEQFQNWKKLTVSTQQSEKYSQFRNLTPDQHAHLKATKQSITYQ